MWAGPQLGLPQNLAKPCKHTSVFFVPLCYHFYLFSSYFLILFNRGFVGSGIAAVSRKDRIPNEYTWLCSDHFVSGC